MRRRTYLVGCSTALTAGLAGCAGSGGDSTPNHSPDDRETGTSDPRDTTDHTTGTDDGDDAAELTNPSFEDGLTGWRVGKDLPEVPGGGGTVAHGTEVVTEHATDGDRALELYVSGVADDGTIWVEQEVDFTDVETAAVDVYSEMRSANVLSEVAFFAGETSDGGLREADFDRSEDVQDHEGWKTYRYDVTELSGMATIAVGMNVIWETEVRALFDDVELVTQAAPEPGTP